MPIKNISEIPIGAKHWRPLHRQVLAVLSRRVDGWCIYVGPVPGESHSVEWLLVAVSGSKQSEPVARGLAKHLFGLEPGELPYAH